LEPPQLPFSKSITEKLALILLKKFESTGKDREKKLTAIQSVYVRTDFKVETLKSQIYSRMRWIAGAEEFVIFKENPFEKADCSRTFTDNCISDGDIVWFWKKPTYNGCEP